MRHQRLVECLFLSVCLTAGASGCQLFRSHTAITVVAQDAETKQPIPGAEVTISSPLSCCGRTGADGIAHLKAVKTDESGAEVEVAATGYMFEEKNLPAKEIHTSKPAHLMKGSAQPTVQVVVELYAEPRPTIELVVPADYQGMIKAEVQVQDNLPCPAGERLFRVEVPPSGEVQVVGPALLHRSPDFSACYPDGTALSRHAKGVEIGLFWLKSEGKCEYFLVGTESAYQDYCRTARKEEARQRHSSGKGDGRGRRNRRGNPSPADPGQN